MDESTEKLVQQFVTKQLTVATPRKQVRHYYNEQEALAVKTIIDRVLTSNAPMKLIPKGISIVTLRLQYFEGLRYLKTVLDTSYEAKARLVRCSTNTIEGYIEVSPRSYARKDRMPGIVTSIASATIGPSNDTWRDELVTWLDAKPKLRESFSRDGLLLTKEEQKWAASQLEGLEHLFIYEITENTILVVRMDKEEL